MDPAVKRIRDEISGRAEDRKAQRESDDLPEKADLEAIIEGNTKCAKCDGKIRALIEEAQPGKGGMGSDADFKVSIYCPAAGCGWKVTQWRPWSKARPKEL